MPRYAARRITPGFAGWSFGLLAWSGAFAMVFWPRWPGPELKSAAPESTVRILAAGGLWLLSLMAAASLPRRRRAALGWVWLSALPVLGSLALLLGWSLASAAGLGL